MDGPFGEYAIELLHDATDKDDDVSERLRGSLESGLFGYGAKNDRDSDFDIDAPESIHNIVLNF